MSEQNYPCGVVRHLSPPEVCARWRENGWGDAAAYVHPTRGPMCNEYGVPYHACNGVRQDEHYWAWLRAKRLGLTS